MFHPAEWYEQVDDEQRILVMSPLYYDNEDKTQEEYYKDVRKPSTLQSRPPSVASSLQDEPASAHCACAPREPSAHSSQLQLKIGQMSVVCQLGEQHPATSAVTKKLVDGRRPVSDLPAPPGDSHTSDSIVSSPPREPPRPWTLEQV